MPFYTIKEEIRGGTKVRIRLRGGERVVEPHLLGRNRRGDTLVRAYQVGGLGHAEGWQLLRLEEVEQAQLMTEISRVARALKEITRCDKLNIAALGNLVPQLHVHVIARRASDAAWPRPVWGVMPPLAHDAEEVQNFISALRRKIWLG